MIETYAQRSEEEIERFVDSLDLANSGNDRWFREKEIRVFCEEGTNPLRYNAIAHKITRFLLNYGLQQFIVRNKGVSEASTENIEKARRDNVLDVTLLDRILMNEPYRDLKQGGRQHGDVLILKTPMKNNGNKVLVYSNFYSGNLLIHEDYFPPSLGIGLDHLFGRSEVNIGTMNWSDEKKIFTDLWARIFQGLG